MNECVSETTNILIQSSSLPSPPLPPPPLPEPKVTSSASTTLELSITNSSDPGAANIFARLTNPNIRAKKLIYQYVVQKGDNSSDIGYATTSSLALNSGTILDNLGRAATLTLAAPAATNSIREATEKVSPPPAAFLSSIHIHITNPNHPPPPPIHTR